MRRLLIGILLIAIGFYGGFFLAKAQGFGEQAELEARIERVMPSMRTARDAHQYFVDNPDKATHAVRSGQDAEWVIIYDETIDILRIIKGGE